MFKNLTINKLLCNSHLNKQKSEWVILKKKKTLSLKQTKVWIVHQNYFRHQISQKYLVYVKVFQRKYNSQIKEWYPKYQIFNLESIS